MWSLKDLATPQLPELLGFVKEKIAYMLILIYFLPAIFFLHFTQRKKYSEASSIAISLADVLALII